MVFDAEEKWLQYEHGWELQLSDDVSSQFLSCFPTWISFSSDNPTGGGCSMNDTHVLLKNWNTKDD